MNTRTYRLEFSGPVSVFSGHAVAGLLDRKVMRNGQGLPCIPGSSVKGRWRFIAARLLAAAPADSGLSLHKPDAFCKEREDACTLCRLFGNPALAGAILVGQAEPEGELRETLLALAQEQTSPVFAQGAEVRPGIALSRTLRTARENHLFFDEVLPGGMLFSGQVLLRYPLRAKEEAFLRNSFACIDRIGGGKARGRGILTRSILSCSEEAPA